MAEKTQIKTDVKKTALVYFGHGLSGYYGIQRLMHGELREKVAINLVVVSDCSGNTRGSAFSTENREKAALVRNAALDYGIEVYSGRIGSESDESKKVKNIINSNDLGIVMNFDKKITKRVFDIPLWNIHPSDLPKYRGGAPLEHIIVNDDFLRITVHELT